MSLEVGPTRDIDLCQRLRHAVFVVEQGVPVNEEVDGQDAAALHVLARDSGIPVGCARVLLDGDTAKIGRVCVLSAQRGLGYGKALVRAAIDVAGAQGALRVKLGAQIDAVSFYAALGFDAYGPVFMDAGIAHRMMVRPVAEPGLRDDAG